ncbi:hypothetical protein ACT29H_06570 [Thermophagus sp. OGC60D27]|uniref:hypothetical protein n=1 Tax=Thermophagus sp. OGC60D27 TaxID=3458415 RepID=UPI0040377B62
MVKQIILLMAVFFVCESYGQKLSIELSIEWKYEESDVYNGLKINVVPYLKIRYNNLTNDSIFLPKVYKNAFFLPQLAASTLVADFKLSDFDKIHLPSIKRSVFIGGMPPNNIQWEVLPDSIDFYSEHEVGEINQLLSDIYETVFRFNENNTLRYNQKSDIKESQILGELREDFVFLLPYSKHVEYYNLFGFKVVGGDYSFALSINEINDFLFTFSVWDNEKEKWEFKEVKLPEKVGGYHLYNGDFYTNEIKITF